TKSISDPFPRYSYMLPLRRGGQSTRKPYLRSHPDYSMKRKNNCLIKWFMLQLSQRSVEEFKEQTERKLRGLRCPDHRQGPRLRFHGTSLLDISIQMSACCE